MISKVTICKYDIKHGMQSLYLQYSPAIRDKKTMKMTGRETLGLYIYKDPKTEEQHLHNRNHMQEAEAIRSTRVMSIINSAFGLTDNDAMQEDFLAYFAVYIKFKHQRWHKVYRHFSNDTLELCGERSEGLIFKGLTRVMTQYPLKSWIKEAGIEKSISFHCFRHTFATLQLAADTDIYTVSKLLTHRHVSTTETYANIVNEKKIESSRRITLKD